VARARGLGRGDGMGSGASRWEICVADLNGRAALKLAGESPELGAEPQLASPGEVGVTGKGHRRGLDEGGIAWGG
jgi:hypothetical protein